MHSINKTILATAVALTLSACGSESTDAPVIHESQETKQTRESLAIIDDINGTLDEIIVSEEDRIVDESLEVISGIDGELDKIDENIEIKIAEDKKEDLGGKGRDLDDLRIKEGIFIERDKWLEDKEKYEEQQAKDKAEQDFKDAVLSGRYKATYDVTIEGSSAITSPVFVQEGANDESYETLYEMTTDQGVGFGFGLSYTGEIVSINYANSGFVPYEAIEDIRFFITSGEDEGSYTYCNISTDCHIDELYSKVDYSYKSLPIGNEQVVVSTEIGDVTLDEAYKSFLTLKRDTPNDVVIIGISYTWNYEYGIVNAEGMVQNHDKKWFDNGEIQEVNHEAYSFKFKNPNFTSIKDAE